MPIPEIPENMPAVIHRRFMGLGRLLMRCMGWRITGTIPNEKKLIVAGAPHTSNWDFIIALPAILALGVKASILMKKEAFLWPFSIAWGWFGFIPTDRNASGGVVGDVVRQFTNSDSLWLAISPEGTRGKVVHWKKGFLRMAYDAGVPILLLSYDYPSKTLHFGELFIASGDHDSDLQKVRSYYSRFQGKNPARH